MFNTNIENNITVLDKLTRANENFDIIKRVIRINKRKSVLYFIDGLLKEAIMEKMMEFFYGITVDDFFTNTETFVENCVPYIEVDKSKNANTVVTALLSGIAIITSFGARFIPITPMVVRPVERTSVSLNLIHCPNLVKSKISSELSVTLTSMSLSSSRRLIAASPFFRIFS